MSFVSYSQNLEDLMLHRALKDVKNGFYIDVGANDPVHDSVTKAFYDAGWHGVNVEPELKFFKKLQQERVRDINLNCAVSSQADEITLFVSNIRGRSTTKENIVDLQNEHEFLDEKVTVKALTLDEIVSQNNINTIHFLKIDVEGAEEDVLKSISLENIRPWILLVEATLPGTNEDISATWENLITSHNYAHVYFDGINRYYLADEKQELAKHFTYPPNVLDDYIHYEHKLAMQKANYFSLKLQNEREAWIQTHKKLLEDMNKLLEDINDLKIENALLLNSKSWKITKPLRVFLSYFKKVPSSQPMQTQKTEKNSVNIYPKTVQELSTDAQEIYKELDCESL